MKPPLQVRRTALVPSGVLAPPMKHRLLEAGEPVAAVAIARNEPMPAEDVDVSIVHVFVVSTEHVGDAPRHAHHILAMQTRHAFF